MSGCLTSDTKEVHITLNDDGVSGTGKIIFSGIASTPGDSEKLVSDDFNSLIADYYQGKKIELQNRGMKNVRKKLYVEDGNLMAEIDFDFDDLSAVGLYRYRNSGPYMYYTISDGFLTSGDYASSNGTYLGDRFPVIFWDSSQHDIYYKMQMTTSQEPKRSLTPNFAAWQARQH
ncbi:MAG TPA: hypothetical protein VGM92_10875 [Candidatus Kapabacteria bacterium]|jgi:hypothetical protein